MRAGSGRRPLSHVRNVSNDTANNAANSLCLRSTARLRSRSLLIQPTRCHRSRLHVNRPPASMTGDPWPFRRLATTLTNARCANSSGKSSIVKLRRCGATSQDRSLCSSSMVQLMEVPGDRSKLAAAGTGWRRAERSPRAQWSRMWVKTSEAKSPAPNRATPLSVTTIRSRNGMRHPLRLIVGTAIAVKLSTMTHPDRTR